MRNQEFAATIERNAGGFTLIEVMIVVAIVAVLAAIAIPNYSDYIRRGKIMDATNKLSSMRVKMEQWFLDNRSYADSCVAPPAGILDAPGPDDEFTISCPTPPSATAYQIQAAGNAAKGMGGFTYTIDNTNAKTSTGPSSTYTNPNCWATRKDGSCN